MGSYKKVGLSHEMGLIDTPPFISSLAIAKISSLSCQKVADSITSSKMGNKVAKQTSVLLRNVPEYIRGYPSAYCTE